MNIERVIEECIFSTPLILLTIKDKKVLSKVDNYLPYSTGFEIECNELPDFNVDDFKKIPDIVDVNVDISEQRYRIPNGARGLICLYNICEQLRINSELNFGSGIHYHIDMTDCYKEVSDNHNMKANQDWMLEELDSWEYKGKYNNRSVSISNLTWIRFNSLKTMECRIGEMSFDYKVLVKRILHLNDIARRLRERVGAITYKEFEPLDKEKLINYVSRVEYINKDVHRLQRKLQELIENSDTPKTLDQIQNLISSRIQPVKRVDSNP